MAFIEVYLLQHPRIVCGGELIHFSYKKMEAMLYYLFVEREAERSAVVELLWGDSDASLAYQNLRHALYTLRRQLGCNLVLSEPKSRLRINTEQDIYCDLWDFVDGGNLTVYTGPFLQDFTIRGAKPFDEWKEMQLVHLQSLYLKQLGTLAHTIAEQGDVSLAISLAERYLSVDSMDESIVILLMRLHAKQSNFGKATALYGDLVRRLADELGITPLKETTSVYYEVLNAWNASTTLNELDSSHLPVGKRRPRQELNEALSRLRNGKGRPGAFLLQGEPGVGKSFLMEYYLKQCTKYVILSIMTNCYRSEMETPLMPWYTLYMQLSTLPGVSLPEACAQPLSRVAGDTPDPRAVQDAVLLALSHVAAQRPLMIGLEDIHWMDEASLSVLHQVLRRLRGDRILVLCSCNNFLSESAQRFLYNGTKDGLLVTLTIRCFSREEAEEFLALSGLPGYDADLKERIYSYTGGNAQKLGQLVSTLADHDGLDTLEAKLEKMLRFRLNGLLPEARQVLDLISVFPDAAPFSMLSAITKHSKLELLCICDDLERRTLIEERMENGEPYLFLTQQLVKLLANQPSHLTQRILHLRIATLLEEQSSTPDGLCLERLIYHFEKGGEPQKALKYKILQLDRISVAQYELLPASDGSPLKRESLASEMAGPQKILELQQQLEKQRSAGWKAELPEALLHLLELAHGRYCVHCGDYARGLPLLTKLLQTAAQRKDAALELCARKQLAFYGIQSCNLPFLSEQVEAGLALAQQQDGKASFAEFLRLQAYQLFLSCAYEEACDLLIQSITLLTELECRQPGSCTLGLAGAYHYLAECGRRMGQISQAFANYETAITLSQKAVAVFFTNYGQAVFHQGDFPHARSLFAAALAAYDSSSELFGKPVALAYGALFDVLGGDIPLATRKLSMADLTASQIGSPFFTGIVHYVKARILQLQGEDALEDCQKARLLLEALPAPEELLWLDEALGRQGAP